MIASPDSYHLHNDLPYRTSTLSVINLGRLLSCVLIETHDANFGNIIYVSMARQDSENHCYQKHSITPNPMTFDPFLMTGKRPSDQETETHVGVL